MFAKTPHISYIHKNTPRPLRSKLRKREKPNLTLLVVHNFPNPGEEVDPSIVGELRIHVTQLRRRQQERHRLDLADGLEKLCLTLHKQLKLLLTVG